jgi:hypothetical protein
MLHEGSNLMGSLRRRLTEVIVAGLTGVTAAVITSIYGWPGAITGAAFVPMFTTTISAIYTGYVDRAAKMVLTADRPAPPPLDPLAARPPPPPLDPLAARPPPPPLDPLAARPPPPPLDPTSRAPRLPKLSQVSAALRWVSLESPERRRSILDSGLRLGVVAAIVGLGIVTAFEIELGGNLSCYFWHADCSPGGINPPPPSIVSAINSVCRG